MAVVSKFENICIQGVAGNSVARAQHVPGSRTVEVSWPESREPKRSATTCETPWYHAELKLLHGPSFENFGAGTL